MATIFGGRAGDSVEPGAVADDTAEEGVVLDCGPDDVVGLTLGVDAQPTTRMATTIVVAPLRAGERIGRSIGGKFN